MNRPLVYYSVSLFLGCLSSQAYAKDYLLGAALTASFLVVLFATLNRKFFVLCLCFFSLGIICFLLYFNLGTQPIQKGYFDSIRVVEKKNYDYIGSYKGKKILLKGIKDKLEKGKRLWVYGDFYDEKNYEKGIIGSITVEKFQYLDDDLISKIQSFKKTLYAEFKKTLGVGNAGEVMSLCFGDTENLNPEQMDEYKQLGVIHAISVSGFHMAVIYKLLEAVAGTAAAAPIALLYVVFTGSEPATARAFLMIFVLKSSKRLWRNYDSLSSLSLSAIILIVCRPFYICDLGFILSYLSTLGILLYYGKIRKMLFKLPKLINDSISISLSAQCFSMPYIAMTLQYFSPVFIISNLILLPFYSVIVVLGNIALLALEIKPVFQCVSYLINSFQAIIHWINSILLVVKFKSIYFTYTDGIFMIALLFCFALVKKGFKQWKYLPACLILVVVFQHYYIFTEVAYVNVNGVQGIMVKHRSSSVLALKGKCTIDKEELKNKYHIADIYENIGDKCVLGLKGGSKVVIELDGTKKLNVEIISEKKRILLTENRNFYDMNKSDKYDIIEVVDTKNYVSKTMFLTYWNMKRYKIVFGRAYIL